MTMSKQGTEQGTQKLPPPRAMVVFESMFGNTEHVARAVGIGLAAGGVPTLVTEVSEAPAEVPASVDLLVLGAPTHAFSLSRPSTRADAVRQGADADRADVGMREWLECAYHAGVHDLHVAVFDTRASKVRRLPAAAGPKAARLVKHRGFELVGRPMAFLVEDIGGPLVDGELERAEGWGRLLSTRLGSAAPAV
jgi:hypothetical protein